MSVFSGSKFKRLRDAFYEKLKDSGFRDIENEWGEITDHKTAHDLKAIIAVRDGQMEDVRDYYTWALGMLIHGTFKLPVDRKIWEMHADGLSTRKIAEVVSLDQTWVCVKIKRIKVYLRDQHDN